MESSNKSRSSRRKPNKTHRISADAECDESAAEFMIRDHISEGLSDSAPQSDYSNAELSEEATIEDDSSTVDSVSESLVLPEGTIVVQPEAVEDSAFDGPEFGSGNKRTLALDIVPAIVHCTACNQRIDTSKCDVIFQHPILKVLLCKRCHETLLKKRLTTATTIMTTAFKQCTWCATGIDLICCDFCSAMFCKVCIRRNLGRSTLDSILNTDNEQKWHCFICNPQPLADLVKSFTRLVVCLDNPAQRQPRTSVRLPPPTEPHKSHTAANNNNEASKPATKSSSSSTAISRHLKPDAALFSAAWWRSTSGSLPTSSDMAVTEHNVWQVVEKLLAATQSMSMLLGSLNDDLRRSAALLTPASGTAAAAGPECVRKRREMATKLWRAFIAYRKSFGDIEKYTKTTTTTLPASSVPTTSRTPVSGAANATRLSSHKVPARRYVPPVKASQPAEVIELSDSDDDNSKCEIVEPEEKKQCLEAAAIVALSVGDTMTTTMESDSMKEGGGGISIDAWSSSVNEQGNVSNSSLTGNKSPSCKEGNLVEQVVLSATNSVLCCQQKQ